MRCDDFRLRWDGLEPGSDLPWGMRRHLASCPTCRRERDRLESAIASWRLEEAGLAEGGPAEVRIMAAVLVSPRPRRELSMGQWILSGLFLALSCVLVPLALFYDGFGPNFDDALLFHLALVVGVGLAVFGMLFIGSHFEELRARLEGQGLGRIRIRS